MEEYIPEFWDMKVWTVEISCWQEDEHVRKTLMTASHYLTSR